LVATAEPTVQPVAPVALQLPLVADLRYREPSAHDVITKEALSAMLAGPLLLYAHSSIVDVRMIW
jgi:hypothetical protein